ncbi:PH domain-containing protein [Candidatus Micrarchaeota archaeon]|nr:PH domain-containing protein [Candidatus Micrarchaeota archaeon]
MTSIFLKPSGRVYYISFSLAFFLISALLIWASPLLPFNPYQLVFILIILALVASLAIFFYFQYQYIHLEEDTVTIRQGFLNSRISIIPIKKVIEVRSDYSLVDRLLQMGTLYLDTAGTANLEITFRFVPRENIHTFLGAFKRYQDEIDKEEKKDNADSW